MYAYCGVYSDSQSKTVSSFRYSHILVQLLAVQKHFLVFHIIKNHLNINNFLTHIALSLYITCAYSMYLQYVLYASDKIPGFLGIFGGF